MIKAGSKWSGSDSRATFRVIQVVELDGRTWIHYINENQSADSNREYSCYQESFLSRFRELPDDQR